MTEQEQKAFEGTKTKLREYKALLRQYRRDQQVSRDLRMLSIANRLHAERIATKLEKAAWTVAYDSPRATAKEIKAYLKKILKGLGLV